MNLQKSSSFKCSCFEGYVLSYDGWSCIQDISNLVVPEVTKDIFEITKLTPDKPGLSCPKDWISLGGNHLKHGKARCYFTYLAPQSHEKAKKMCEEMGATLAIIDDKEQNYFLGKLFGRMPEIDMNSEDNPWLYITNRRPMPVYDAFWIGLEYEKPKIIISQDLQDETQQNKNTTIDPNPIFTWPNGQPSKLKKEWIFRKPYEVNELIGNYCVLSNYGGVGAWSNEACIYEAAFACSRDVEV